MDIEQTRPILDFLQDFCGWIFGLLGIGSSGLMYAKQKKMQEQSKARISEQEADIAEINAYKTRIKSLGEEIVSMEERMQGLRAKLTETETALDSAMSLISKQEITIDKLNDKIKAYEELNAKLTADIEALRKK